MPTIPEEEPVVVEPSACAVVTATPEPLFDIAKELADAARMRAYVEDVEARVNDESWAFLTHVDTLILKQWLADDSVYQVALNNNASTQRAVLPKPIKLIADESFSSPMVSMGKRDANVNMLKNMERVAPDANKGKIDAIPELYKSGKIPNFLSALSVVNRLMKPTKGAAYVAKTEATFSALVAKYQDAESATGKLNRDTIAKRSIEENVMVR